MQEHTDIFVSHAAVDQEIAAAIKTHLKAAFPTIDSFVSSDPEDLPPGSPWVEKILKALAEAKLVLAVTTERGLSRKWVWFESGRTWHSGIECVPCCLGKIRKSDLPTPFSFLQAINIDEEAGFSALIKKCGKTFDLSPKALEIGRIVEELRRVDVRAEERQRTLDDPDALELQQEVDTVMQRLDTGSRETLRLLLKYGEMTEGVARTKVGETGKTTNETMYVIGLANKTGWLKKTQSSPFPHASQEADGYEISQKMRAPLRAWFVKQLGAK
jgi:TIR domain